MTQLTRLLFLLWVALFACSSAFADSLSLTVSGNITRFTDKKAGVYQFSEKDLLALKPYTIKTATSWTPVSTFVGPRLSDILEKVGAKGTDLLVIALNDYDYTIPVSDASRYGVILAYMKDGKRIERSKFGPLFVIYPKDDFEELQTRVTDAKFVWQVAKIVVK